MSAIKHTTLLTDLSRLVAEEIVSAPSAPFIIFDAHTPWKGFALYGCMALQMAVMYACSFVTAAIQSDLAQLKTDVSELKTDVSELKTDVSELKTMKKDVSELKKDMARLIHHLMPNDNAVVPSQCPCAPTTSTVTASESAQPIKRQRAPVDEYDDEAVIADVIDLMICDIEADEAKDPRLCELTQASRSVKHARDVEAMLQTTDENLKSLSGVIDGPLSLRNRSKQKM